MLILKDPHKTPKNTVKTHWVYFLQWCNFKLSTQCLRNILIVWSQGLTRIIHSLHMENKGSKTTEWLNVNQLIKLPQDILLEIPVLCFSEEPFKSQRKPQAELNTHGWVSPIFRFLQTENTLEIILEF